MAFDIAPTRVAVRRIEAGSNISTRREVGRFVDASPLGNKDGEVDKTELRAAREALKGLGGEDAAWMLRKLDQIETVDIGPSPGVMLAAIFGLPTAAAKRCRAGAEAASQDAAAGRDDMFTLADADARLERLHRQLGWSAEVTGS
jgi:hypothetical protein